MNAVGSGNDSLSLCSYTSKPNFEKLTKIAKLYAAAFAEPPWNEYLVCSNRHFAGKGATDLTNCLKCDQKLTLAYPEEETVDYIGKELEKEQSMLATFENIEDNVLAAGWGYLFKIDEFKNKYHSPLMREKCVNAIKDNIEGDAFFYISEVMVDPIARQKKCATKITTALIEKATALGHKVIMRTHCESPMSQIANKFSMTPIINKSEDTDMAGRVLYLLK